MAGGLGFEPRLATPKTAVLPLDDPPTCRFYPPPGYTGLMVRTSTDRIDRFSSILSKRNWDVFLGCSPVTMGYLHGFFEGSHERFMSLAVSKNGDLAIVCPALSASQARRAGLDDIRTWDDSQNPYELVRQLANEWGFGNGTIALDMDMPAHLVLKLQENFPDADFVIGQPALSELRRRKDSDELAKMKEAARIVDESLASAYAAIRSGTTELVIQGILHQEIRARGGTPTFCTVAIGAGSAEPHHISDSTQMGDGDIVLMDFGCDFERYQSDITLVVCCGKATDEMKGIYEIVFGAHMAARNTIRPNVASEKIDQAARSVIETAGYGPNFCHRVGHGIGMEVHEEPYMVAGNKQLLEAGNCFSVEPGIYFEGKWGIRLENIVVVTESGHESLNQEISPNLFEIGA